MLCLGNLWPSWWWFFWPLVFWLCASWLGGDCMSVSLIDEFRALVGSPPVGYEFLEYVLISFLLVFLVSAAFGILKTVFSWIGGGM